VQSLQEYFPPVGFWPSNFRFVFEFLFSLQRHFERIQRCRH
jgi:hypothetical protein